MQENVSQKSKCSLNISNKSYQGTHSRVPRLKTWCELEQVELAPTKADPELAGVMTTLFGTPVNTTLPRTIRHPFLITGTAVIVILAYNIYETCMLDQDQDQD